MQDDPNPGVFASPNENNILFWEAVIFGYYKSKWLFISLRPSETIFDEGIFKLTIQFSEDYPNKAPIVKFVSSMFHPNSNSKYFCF